MEVATLTATLEANVASFMSNMKGADRQAEDTREKLGALAATARLAAIALEGVKMDASQSTATKAYAAEMQKAVNSLADEAGSAGQQIKDMSMQQAQVVKFIADATVYKKELKDIRDDALAATVALDGLDIAPAPGGRRGSGGQFLPGRNFVGGPVVPSSYVRGVPATTEELLARWEEAARRMPLAITEVAGGAIPLGPISGTGDSYVRMVQGQYAKQEHVFSKELVPSISKLDQAIWGLTGEIGRPIKGSYGDFLTGRPFPKGDTAGAVRYLKKHGYTLDPATGGYDKPPPGLADALGFGGDGSRWGFLGLGGRGGRWGRWGIPTPPHARFGSLLALGGFGLDRMIASTIGIGGSMLGGLLGGGVLAGGALGTMAVGAGTNMAGIGQALHGIHTTSADLDALNSAIAQYGKNSIQAAQAQAQLNYDLKSFQPVARNAILAASQTSQSFGDMFHKVTGMATKTGAMIIQQAMQVGMKFLPTIGKFAAQNMKILQVNIQPFFKWLQNPAFQGPGRGGGLGIFTDLEKIFQRNFPTAIHAGSQSFELLFKTVDIAAQHVGHFLTVIDKFVTRMNNQDFGRWAKGVHTLIGLFHDWLGVVTSLGRVVFAVFAPAVGLGGKFAKVLSGVFNEVAKYLKQPGTKHLLNELFSAHLVQAIDGFGKALKAMLPLVFQLVSAFIQLEIIVASAFAAIFTGVAKVFTWLTKMNKELGGVPFKILGWAGAIGIVFFANAKLLGGLAFLAGRIPIIGRLFVVMADVAALGWRKMGAMVLLGIKQVGLFVLSLFGIGPAAEASTAEVVLLDEAMVAAASEATVLDAVAAPALIGMAGAAAIATGGILILVAALAAAYYLMQQIKNAEGSFPNHPLAGVSKSTIEHHKKAFAEYQRYLYEQGQIDPTTGKFVPMPGHHALTFAQWYEKNFHKPLTGPGSDASKSGIDKKMQEQMNKQLAAELKALGIPYKLVKGVPTPANVTTPTTHGATPTGYLNKQQAMTAQARIDIAQGQNKAAVRLLKLEQQQLQALLKTAKTQAERTAILSQLATVAGLIQSTKRTAGVNVAGGQTWQLPLAMQVAIQRADALAALNPNLQGPTSQQYKLALKAKAAAMKAIDSHTLSMQQLIQAWQIVQQANSVIAQHLGVMANTYHAVSAAAIVGAVKNLTHAQQIQLEERISQRTAHRGYAPNQSAVGGAGSTVASPHHRHRPHHHGGTGGGGGGGGARTESASHGTTIQIDKVEIHGVQNVRQLAAEIDKLARQKSQRAGGRR